MNFLRNLFSGGGGSAHPQDRDGLYVFVRPKMCQEVLKIRINLINDLSRTEDENGYFVRKFASATRCPFQAEIELTFDKRKNLQNATVHDGDLVDEAAYEAWLAEQEAD